MKKDDNNVLKMMVHHMEDCHMIEKYDGYYELPKK